MFPNCVQGKAAGRTPDSPDNGGFPFVSARCTINCVRCNARDATEYISDCNRLRLYDIVQEPTVRYRLATKLERVCAVAPNVAAPQFKRVCDQVPGPQCPESVPRTHYGPRRRPLECSHVEEASLEHTGMSRRKRAAGWLTPPPGCNCDHALPNETVLPPQTHNVTIQWSPPSPRGCF